MHVVVEPRVDHDEAPEPLTDPCRFDRLEVDEPATGFRHRGLIYEDDAEYLAGTLPFIREGVAAGDPTLVVVPAAKVDILRRVLRLQDDASVRMVPMEEAGANPAWIIPTIAAFVEAHAVDGRRVRVLCEPVRIGRTVDHLIECDRNDALCNVAFGATTPLDLLCAFHRPWCSLGALAQAASNHSQIADRGRTGDGPHLDPRLAAWTDRPLSPVPRSAKWFIFDPGTVSDVRGRCAQHAVELGLPLAKVDDLVLAVDEAGTNSIRHGGGTGTIAIWRESDRVLCQVTDRGRISDPLAGRRRPPLFTASGRGMWLIHQLTDLVQIREVAGGQALRLHFACG